MRTDELVRPGQSGRPGNAAAEQLDQPIRLRSGLPTNLEAVRFLLTGLRYPTGSGADRVYGGASMLVVVDDVVQSVSVRIGDRFTAGDQKWRLDTALELQDFESAALISRIRRRR